MAAGEEGGQNVRMTFVTDASQTLPALQRKVSDRKRVVTAPTGGHGIFNG